MELEVPRKRADNICMMNEMRKKVRAEQEQWIDDEISKVYWAFADGIGDESSEQLNEYLNGPFKVRLQSILWEDYKAYIDVTPN